MTERDFSGERREKEERGNRKERMRGTKKIESKGGDEIESELLFISIPTVSDA